MFFRLKQSGSRRYLQIVENRRQNGAVRQHVIATLGRLDDLTARGGLAALLSSGARYCDQILLLSALADEESAARVSAGASAARSCSGACGRISASRASSPNSSKSAPSSSRSSGRCS